MASKKKTTHSTAADIASVSSPDPSRWRDALRATAATDLAAADSRATPGYSGDKASAETDLATVSATLESLQEKLFAEATAGGQKSLLLVIQGMDTSGKGGIISRVGGAMNPQGVRVTSFKAPTDEEKQHDFLWRIRKGLPTPGQVAIFDRSHYEDVLIVRVLQLAPQEVWEPRYDQINTFEAEVAASGTSIVKVMLHLSPQEQQQRLADRLADPSKHWKFNPGDVDQRAHWHDYTQAYQSVLERTSTDVAPWYVVPADRKWYARLAVANLVAEHLAALHLAWPAADFDVAEQQRRVAASVV